MSSAGWSCGICTFVNVGDGCVCEMCQSMDPQRQSQLDKLHSQSGWTCQSCTYLNPFVPDNDQEEEAPQQIPPAFRGGGGVASLADQSGEYGFGFGGGFSVAMQAFNGGLGDEQAVSPRTAARPYTCQMCGGVDREQRQIYDKKKQEKDQRRWERIQKLRQQKQEEERRKKEEEARKKKSKENEEKREGEQLKERIKVFVPLYEEIYRTHLQMNSRRPPRLSSERIYELAATLFKYSHLDDLLDKKEEDDDCVMLDTDPKVCKVCFMDFDGMDTKRIRAQNCNHAMTCSDCFQQYIAVKVRDEEVMPWIPCPHEDCTIPLHPHDILGSGIDVQMVFALFKTHIRKHIARDINWVECVTPKCEFGFYIEGDTSSKKQKCKMCGKRQVVQRESDKADESFQEMVKEGVVRPCPKCGNLQMKDYGICNVIQCPKCSIWWNWKSNETGRTERELKNRARSVGTLWEPGELNYQRRLEQSDPDKFKDLLEKNGIEFNPNYVRGT